MAHRSDAHWCPACRHLRRLAEYKRSDLKTKHDACPICGRPKFKPAQRCHICMGILRKETQRGEGNPNWKGGRIRTDQGYIQLRNPIPGARPRYIGEHVVVWEAAHGPVPNGWHIHHLNGIRDDNRLENLQAMSKHLHQGLHVGTHFKEEIRRLEARIRELESDR